jgi:ABC-type lipoprotein release transport system permease subunit
VRQVLRVAAYRFRSTFGRRWGGYLAIILLTGVLAGIAMAAVAGGRRTQSAFPRFLTSTNPSDLSAEYSGSDPVTSYDPAFTASLRQLPHVKHVESFAVLDAAIFTPDGTFVADNSQVAVAGTVDGALLDVDRFAITEGRRPDPTRADEVAVSQSVAESLGLHVGQVLTLAVVTADTAATSPGQVPDFYERVPATIVGVGLINRELITDDVGRYPGYIVTTPAFTKPLLGCCVAWTWNDFQLERGAADVADVEREYIAALPKGISFQFHEAAPVAAQAERTVRPQAIALAAFGAITAAAGLVIAGQAVSRQLRSNREDLKVLRSIGADSAMTVIDGLTGALSAIVVGGLFAVAVAIALSPLAPIGPMRAVDPSRGFAADWTVLALGSVVVIGTLGAFAIAAALREAPHRVARREASRSDRRSSVTAAAAASGLPAPAVAGIRFAFENGRSRTAAPVRSAMVGATLAIVVLVATLTFGSSLSALVSHPALYGWDWSSALESTEGYGPIPRQGRALLDQDAAVAAWTGDYFGSVDIDGQQVPGMFGDTRAALTPPILSGHALESTDQIVLGPATLEQLHKHLGDSVELSYGNGPDPTKQTPPTSLRIVGTAAMPAVGISDGLHSSVGIGALASSNLVPAPFLNMFGPDGSGPNIIFVRFRAGTDVAAATRSLQTIADSINTAAAADPALGNYTTVRVLPVQRPAEIVNYRAMGNTPALLALGLGAAAIVALGLTLMTSVRRRRRDLALLKTLGFTRRQLMAVVAWQASVAALIGVAIGVPTGIALGRWLWILFARQIFVVPRPTVPALPITLIALGALVLAIAVAALPGRSAARTRTAILLRAE